MEGERTSVRFTSNLERKVPPGKHARVSRKTPPFDHTRRSSKGLSLRPSLRGAGSVPVSPSRRKRSLIIKTRSFRLFDRVASNVPGIARPPPTVPSPGRSTHGDRTPDYGRGSRQRPAVNKPRASKPGASEARDVGSSAPTTQQVFPSPETPPGPAARDTRRARGNGSYRRHPDGNFGSRSRTCHDPSLLHTSPPLGPGLRNQRRGYSRRMPARDPPQRKV